MERIWNLKKQGDQNEVKHLSAALNVNMVIARLLVQRGIKTFNEAKAFFRPRLSDLHDPFLMKDMDKAVKRLEDAISNNEKILIYGDYDVDGTTSVSLVYSFLRKFYDHLDYYIPNRYSEGYGISYKGINYAFRHNYNLIIALDCGIKAAKKIEYAKKYDIDFIICDHHTPDNKLPDAVAVLDPERDDCNYPYKYLSGCGVGFKLIHAYSLKNNIPFENILKYIDLVAVSIASDIVPLTGENRILTYYGLKKLNENPCTGLKAIISVSGIDDKEINVNDIVFKIGPRINAAGRMESGKQVVDLLISNNPDEAILLCEKINHYNQTRRNIDKNITQEAMDEISATTNKSEYTTILYNPKWHKGVIGIVASRLIENYYRPTIILTESNGLAAGSARSVDGFDLYKAITECSDLLESFGGHTYAAGLTLKIENIIKFKNRFEEVVKETITREQLTPHIEIDTELSLKDITPKFFRILKQFEPFGPENMNPMFFSENVSDNGSGRLVGNEGEHIKLNLIQEEEPFHVLPAIAFNQSQHFEKITVGNSFDIAYTIVENNYRGNVTLQLNIKDIKFDN